MGDSLKMKVDSVNKPSTDWLDIARLIATIAVITIHVSAPYIYKFGMISNFNWNIYNAFDSLTRFAVPFFIMISGALLLDKKMLIGDFLKRRFLRILIPFMFWSIAYSVYHYILLNNSFDLAFFKFLADSILNGASYHLWYIYMLIGLYLTIPVFNRWVIDQDNGIVKYYLLLWLVTIIIIFFRLKLHKDINLSVFSGYLGYLVLGYFISKTSYKVNPKLIFAIILLSAFITFFMTYSATSNDGYYNDKFYNYLSLNVVVLSASLFMLLKQLRSLPEKVLNTIKYLNKYGFGIYLVHVFVLDGLQLLNINGAFLNPVLGVLFTVGVCYFISLMLITLMSRFRILSNLIN